MAKIEVIGGDIPAGKWDTKFLFNDIFPEIVAEFKGEYKKLNLNYLKAADIVDQEEIKSIASSAGWGIATGIVAGIFTGGLGLIAGGVAGAMAKGQKTEVTFMGEMEDGRKFLGITDTKTWKRIMAIPMTPMENRNSLKELTAKIESV